MNELQQARMQPLQGFRFLSLTNPDTQTLGKRNSRTVYPSITNPEDFSRLSVHVHYARPDEDIDLWVQPYLSYANEPSNEQVDKAAKAANAALTKAILPMPLITHQEFLDAKSKEDE